MASAYDTPIRWFGRRSNESSHLLSQLIELSVFVLRRVAIFALRFKNREFVTITLP